MNILSLVHQELSPLGLNVLKLSLWLFLLAAIFIPIERLFSLHKKKTFRAEVMVDICYFFLNSLLLRFLLVLPLSGIALILHHLFPSGSYSWAASMPLWVRLLAAMIAGEIGSYWGHRWLHENPLLWRFHEIHHSAKEMDWLVNTRGHPFDFVFVRACGLLPIYILGLAQPTQDSVDPLPLFIAIFGTVWSFFIHANLRWRFGFVERLVSTPAFHHWHHAKDSGGRQYQNFAAILPLVDRIFGTYYLPSKGSPASYGTSEPLPPSLVRQLLHPFGRRT